MAFLIRPISSRRTKSGSGQLETIPPVVNLKQAWDCLRTPIEARSSKLNSSEPNSFRLFKWKHATAQPSPEERPGMSRMEMSRSRTRWRPYPMIILRRAAHRQPNVGRSLAVMDKRQYSAPTIYWRPPVQIGILLQPTSGSCRIPQIMGRGSLTQHESYLDCLGADAINEKVL